MVACVGETEIATGNGFLVFPTPLVGSVSGIVLRKWLLTCEILSVRLWFGACVASQVGKQAFSLFTLLIGV